MRRTEAERGRTEDNANSCDWTRDDLKDYFEEHAAIAEFCGGLPRDEAEASALSQARKYNARRCGYTRQLKLFD